MTKRFPKENEGLSVRLIVTLVNIFFLFIINSRIIICISGKRVFCTLLLINVTVNGFLKFRSNIRLFYL